MSTSILLVHHATNRGKPYHLGSLRGLRDCLEAKALAVELDIVPLADSDFALIHDQRLEKGTDGKGLVSLTTSDEVQRLHYLGKGTKASEPVGLLSQAVACILEYPHVQEFQLDLKPEAILTDSVLKRLLRLIEPIKSKTRVSSAADWALRRLRVLDPRLLLGFDPFLYLDVSAKGHLAGTPPFRVGAYGYRDDHPLGSRRWGSPRDYLACRAETLCLQVPDNKMWYLRALLLGRALDEGFDWIEYLHAQGAEVTTWTLDPGRRRDLELAHRLVAAGVDRICTNDAPNLAAALDGTVEF
jgi:glycerophosphoryl diester phosphodiesterase